MGKNINLSYDELKDILELTSKKKRKNKKRRNVKKTKKERWRSTVRVKE
jgi:hypothetical protein